MFSDKQIHVDLDTIVAFVIQSRKVSAGGAISVQCCLLKLSDTPIQ